MRKAKVFFMNMALMTATSLLMRTVSVSFQVYISNKIGTAGIGLFSLIMSVFSFAATLATSGIRLGCTRLVAEELGVGNHSGARRSVLYCLVYCLFFGCLSGFLLFTFADFLGTQVLGDARTVLSLRVLAFSLPCMAMASVFGGYFTAVRKVYKSAAAQVLEQFIYIGLTIMGLTVLMPQGLEYACVAIVLGSTVAEFLNVLMLAVLYLVDQHKLRRDQKSSKGLPGKLLRISLPVAFSAYARSGLSSLQHLLIPRGLRKSGASGDVALAAYGTIHGMALPIALFPSVFLYTVADLIVPELAECKALDNNYRIDFIVGKILRGALIFSIGVMGLIFAFSGQLGESIYQNSDVSFFLRVLAPLIPIMYMDATVDGMLKGLGEQVASMRYNIIDALVGTILVYTLLPRFAINGYVVTIFITEMLNFFLSVRRLIVVTRFQMNLFHSIVKPLFCIAGSISAAQLFTRYVGLTLSTTPLMVVQMLLSVLIYLFALRMFSCITRDDVKWIGGILLQP